MDSVHHGPPNFPFFFLPSRMGTCTWLTIWLQTLNCNSLTILNRCIIAGEISGILFILGQHFGGLHRDQRRRLKALGLLNRCGTQCHSLLSCWLEFCRYAFLLDPKFMPSLCLRLSRFYSDSVLRFCISAKGLVLHAFGASVWFWVQTVSIEAGWKCLQSVPLGIVTSSLKLYLFFILWPILWKGLFSGNWLKRPLAWLFQGHAVSLELTGDSL